MAIRTPIPDGGVTSIVISSVSLGLSYLAVIARFYCRYMTGKRLSIDDYLITAALVFTTGTIGVGYALVLNGGAGMHMTQVTMEEIAMSLKLFVPAPLLWAVSTILVKLSILFFYISIFTWRKLRWAVWAVIGLNIAVFTAVIFESFLLCRPFAFTWDKTIPGGVCGSTTHAYLSIAIVNLIIDLMVLVLPMPVLWSLQMPLRKKVAISAILGLGFVICICTAVRIKSVLDLDPNDFTYTMIPDIIFGALEVTLGIVNACLPIMRPLFSKWFGAESVMSTWFTRKTNSDTAASYKLNMMNSTTPSWSPSHRLPSRDDQYSFNKSTTMSSSDAYASYNVSNTPRSNRDIMVKRDIYLQTSQAQSPHDVV